MLLGYTPGVALRLRVCAADAVGPGESRAFAVEGVAVPILVTNVDGTHYATSSVCPHEDVSLEDGERCGLWLACPGHGYEFDLATGRCAHDPSLRLPRYPVFISDGHLYVDLIGSGKR